jgi:hypothetical protein
VGRTWYLDTETKGTGAHVAPLQRAREPRPEEDRLDLVTFKMSHGQAGERARGEPAAPEHPPLTFKLLDVMTSQVLAEGVGARAVVELLEGFNSLVDVRIYARPAGTRRWRLLGLDDQRLLWGFRGSAAPSSARPSRTRPVELHREPAARARLAASRAP